MTAGYAVEDVDVLVIGTGLSGFGLTCSLLSPSAASRRLRRGNVSVAREICFVTHGVRSDSDMFTLDFPFRPWTGTER